jgi:hypothetical protein
MVPLVRTIWYSSTAGFRKIATALPCYVATGPIFWPEKCGKVLQLPHICSRLVVLYYCNTPDFASQNTLHLPKVPLWYTCTVLFEIMLYLYTCPYHGTRVLCTTGMAIRRPAQLCPIYCGDSMVPLVPVVPYHGTRVPWYQNGTIMVLVPYGMVHQWCTYKYNIIYHGTHSTIWYVYPGSELVPLVHVYVYYYTCSQCTCLVHWYVRTMVPFGTMVPTCLQGLWWRSALQTSLSSWNLNCSIP